MVEALAHRLRDQVLDGEIAPGTPLAETEIAAAFGVSRPTAKGAILTLIQGGLLRRDPHRSAYVPQLTAEDVRDLYRVRTPLELEVVRGLASERIVPAGADDAVRVLERLPDETPPSQFIAADLRFHRALVDAAHSPRLSRLYDAILDEIHLSMKQSRHAVGRERIAREHAEVLQHITAGEPTRATETMRQHLDGAAQALATTLSSELQANADKAP